jgi:hypothetical protein
MVGPLPQGVDPNPVPVCRLHLVVALPEGGDTSEERDGRRLARVVQALAVGEVDPQRSMCAAVAEVVGVRAAAVVLLAGGRVLGNVCVSGEIADVVEELQFVTGEGPGVDAFRTTQPVLAPDLVNIDATQWPGFRDEALGAGVRAAFGFPLMIGSICVGALDLYHDRPGPLTDDQLADASASALVVGRSVIGWQADAADERVPWQLEQVPAHRAVIHQAAGMVSVQAGVPVDDALTMLRAYAFAETRSLSDVVAEVVDRRLRFDDDGAGQAR